MEQYSAFAQETAKRFTKKYSTSFSLASILFSKNIRNDIYSIYGLVRLADEIVDTYYGSDKKDQLDALESEVYAAIKRGYSTNIIVQAFQETAEKHKLPKALIRSFFASMRTDLLPINFNKKQYDDYIYGSAEVVGLMCLIVFVGGNKLKYKELSRGAMALGAAYQKVNFLRDMADDYKKLGRYYFPIDNYKDFDETTKQKIIKDINQDLKTASSSISRLPNNSRLAVTVSFRYYHMLLRKLEKTPYSQLKQRRVRIANIYKIIILAQCFLSSKLRLP